LFFFTGEYYKLKINEEIQSMDRDIERSKNYLKSNKEELDQVTKECNRIQYDINISEEKIKNLRFMASNNYKKNIH
jgi:peptidoglycan hydrolase CwlO-like protein